MKLFDYECVTTFWDDFSIAEKFGSKAIRDTFKRAFWEWKDNAEYLTELVMVLNHKIWYWWEKGTSKGRVYAKLYDELWNATAKFAEENLTGEDLDYYFRTTD